MANELFIELSADQEEVVAGGLSLEGNSFFGRDKSGYEEIENIQLAHKSNEYGSESYFSNDFALTELYDNVYTDTMNKFDY